MASNVPYASQELLTISDPMNEDLWADIFIRLPIKTLCRLRLVCKSWNRHLSSRFFAATHHRLNLWTAGKKPFFRVRHDLTNIKSFRYALHYHQDNMLKYLELPLTPNQRSYWLADFFCVIHGVVFFTYHSIPYMASPNSIALWNPTIHKYVSALMPSPDDPEYSFLGFGFDGSKNDFKVVWAPPLSSQRARSYYKVYSVCDGLWRTKEFPDHVKSLIVVSYRVGCFFNGSIHWVMWDHKRSYGLLLFDCEHEEFRTMGLPQGLVVGALPPQSVRTWRFTLRGECRYMWFVLRVVDNEGVWGHLYLE